jgi:hypothetical protein
VLILFDNAHSWNALFFILNGGMILALLKERSDKLSTDEERDVFQNMFEKLGKFHTLFTCFSTYF